MEDILDDEVPLDQALSQPLMEAQVVSDRTPTDLKSTKMTGKQQHMRPTLSSAILRWHLVIHEFGGRGRKEWGSHENAWSAFDIHV